MPEEVMQARQGDLWGGFSESGAIFSADRLYRYTLTRRWDGRPMMAWIGLNPSTADETEDDPTIRRCTGFAKAWGYGGMVMLNLFAYRATDPKEMMCTALIRDPIGNPRNDELIQRVVWAETALAVAAGGGRTELSRAGQTGCWPCWAVTGCVAWG